MNAELHPKVEPAKLSIDLSKLDFEEIKTKSLPQEIQDLLPIGMTELRSLKGSLREHIFIGTLDEVRPSLIIDVNKSGQPAILLSHDQKLFSVVYRNNDKNPEMICESPQKSYIAWQSVELPKQSVAFPSLSKSQVKALMKSQKQALINDHIMFSRFCY